MSGADWDKILSNSEVFDLEGVDLSEAQSRLGQLSQPERDDLVRAIGAEKAKVERRGNVVDTALDVLLAAVKALA